MKAPIDLSIVIVTYKSGEYIRECLGSVHEAAEGVSAEVIVVDNGSDNGCLDFVHREFPGVSLLRNERNEGFAQAVNKGTSTASGRYLMILNPDTRLYPDSLKVLLGFLEKHPTVSVVSPRAVDASGGSIPICRSLPHIGNILRYPVSVLLGGKRLRKPRRFFLDIWEQDRTIDLPRYNGYLTGACLVTRLDYFKDMGMFDGEYFLYGEDADFGYRVRQQGHHAYLVSDATIVHYGGCSARFNPRARIHAAESYLRYIHKNFKLVHGLAYEISFFTLTLLWAAGARIGMQRTDRAITREIVRCFLPSWLKRSDESGNKPQVADNPAVNSRNESVSSVHHEAVHLDVCPGKKPKDSQASLIDLP
jgi:GT2 family glycosyltransferase